MAQGKPIIYYEGSFIYPRWDQHSDAMKKEMLRAWGEGKVGSSLSFVRKDNDEKIVGRTVGMVVDYKINALHPARVGLVIEWVDEIEVGTLHG